MIVYYNGQYLQKSEVAISPDDRCFLFADGVYEVFDEVMMLSTRAEIVPITAVNGRKIRQGYVGPVTRRLQNAFRRLVGPNELKEIGLPK